MLQSLLDVWWSAPIVFLLLLLLYFFTHPEKVAIWSSLIASLFEKISYRSARHAVASDIQGRISSFISSNNAKEILPHSLRFKWIKDNDVSSYIEEKTVVVIMNYHDNNARNFINAVTQYTSKAFLSTVRHKMPREILAAAELAMQKKIIQEKRPDSLDFFHDEVLANKIKYNISIKSIFEKFEWLDTLGYFDNIFLTESIFAGQRLQGLEKERRIKEIKDFVEFLENIENDQFPLEYHGDVFHVHVILVAKLLKRHLKGTAPYVSRARTAQSEKADSVYVAGREKNMDFVDEVIGKIRDEGIGRLEWTRTYKTLDREGNRKNAKMALFRL